MHRRPSPRTALAAALTLLLSLAAHAPSHATDIVLATPLFRYVIGTNAQNSAFIDLASGRDHLRPGPSPCASLRIASTELPATAAAFDPATQRLTLRFHNPLGPAEAPTPQAVLRVVSHPSHIQLTVESCSPASADALTFLNAPLTLAALPSEPFAACALALTLHTRIDDLPALQSHLRAAAERPFGITNASAAIVAAPMDRMRAALRNALTASSQLPHCNVAGPWAAETPFSHGSYLFNFGSLVETNLDEWIGMARSLGFTQIDNHGGGDFFRFGDFELNRKRWPEGWTSWQRIANRLHAAGIGSIFHTYAFFIDKRSRYVTPTPDPRLDAFRTFTLDADLSTNATELAVRESTAGLSTITGFFEHNSVLLHLDNELVSFSGFSTNPPWRFTGLKRGALGTSPASHPAGSPARHLKECFGLLVPNPESTLFEEIAANHADIVNRCGFDGIYLDAIDGASILRGPDSCWYWASKFVVEIQKRLHRPVGMEMSAMWHPFWQYRTRWQAWDLPQRGHVAFVDRHAAAVNGGMLLPLHLGWWDFQSWNPPQIEPSFPEVMDTLAARLVGWNAGISLTGAVDRKRLQSIPLFRRAVESLRLAEELRHSTSLDDATRQRLRQPGTFFTLVTNTTGKPTFLPLLPLPHLADAASPSSLAWTATNPHPAQPLRFRLEALMAASHPDTNTHTLVLTHLSDFANPTSTPAPAPSLTSGLIRTSAPGVSFHLEPTPDAVPGGHATSLTATNAGTVPRNAAWLRLRQSFQPARNLAQHQAVGFWIDGDASGALLAIRLESPQHIAFGAIADRYLPIDFSGPRFVTLVETESTRWSDYSWNDGKSLYNVHRETIHFDAVESATVWLQNIPQGREIRLRLGPILALPMVPATLHHPTLVLEDRRIELPVDLPSGHWIESDGSSLATVCNAQGTVLQHLPLGSSPPLLQSGPNRLRLESHPNPTSSPSPRTRFTAFATGQAPIP